MWPDGMSVVVTAILKPLPAKVTMDTEDVFSLCLWGGVLLVCVAVLILFVNWIRKRYRDGGDVDYDGILTLQDLRDLRDNGEITIKEYEHLRETMIAGAKKMLQKDKRADREQ